MNNRSKYTIEIDLTDEEVQALEQEVKQHNEFIKANGGDEPWTIEQELWYIVKAKLKEKVVR